MSFSLDVDVVWSLSRRHFSSIHQPASTIQGFFCTIVFILKMIEYRVQYSLNKLQMLMYHPCNKSPDNFLSTGSFILTIWFLVFSVWCECQCYEHFTFSCHPDPYRGLLTLNYYELCICTDLSCTCHHFNCWINHSINQRNGLTLKLPSKSIIIEFL